MMFSYTGHEFLSYTWGMHASAIVIFHSQKAKWNRWKKDFFPPVEMVVKVEVLVVLSPICDNEWSIYDATY